MFALWQQGGYCRVRLRVVPRLVKNYMCFLVELALSLGIRKGEGSIKIRPELSGWAQKEIVQKIKNNCVQKHNINHFIDGQHLILFKLSATSILAFVSTTKREDLSMLKVIGAHQAMGPREVGPLINFK